MYPTAYHIKIDLENQVLIFLLNSSGYDQLWKQFAYQPSVSNNKEQTNSKVSIPAAKPMQVDAEIKWKTQNTTQS